jgi:hypothetical protein
MRTTIWLASAVCLAVWSCGTARAEEAAAEGAPPAEEAPTDPTRGKWDSFIDPVRDVEDKYAEGQGVIEEKTGIRFGAGVVESWLYSTAKPSSDVISLYSLDPDHDTAEFGFGQVSAARPSANWIPGFGTKLAFGRTAKRMKADWNGNGVLGVGDEFEKNSFEIEEAYLTWAVPEGNFGEGLSLKGGKFVTLLGAELIEPWLNYNHTRSFLFGLAIPFTHTGGLATYAVNDKLSFTAGGVVGWDNVEDNNGGASGIFNMTWVAHDMLTLATNLITGPEQTGRESDFRTVMDIVATVKPMDKLTLVANYDYGDEEYPDIGMASWQGLALVGNYDFTDRFSAATRWEFFLDNEGTRTGVDQTLWEMTWTAKYLFTQHFSGRLEYRHDNSDEDVFASGDDNLRSTQDVFGFAFTYLFN